ncbi:methyltransferase domain-containing protein [Veronia nyctiphanis]|uniref:hypothetical protein n=1 Tax=Veronia nyctiphanis TaxID=1278244 RepID=UPI00100A42F3|nr:hypothetical protein [Veronia nyctiphanis]
MTDPKVRFSDKVNDYVQFRPDYPDAVAELLLKRCAGGYQVADIGSGTGIFTRQLSSAGFSAVGIEPNDNMRSAALELVRPIIWQAALKPRHFHQALLI